MINIIIGILAVSTVISVIFYQAKKIKKTDNCCNGDCSQCNKKH